MKTHSSECEPGRSGTITLHLAELHALITALDEAFARHDEQRKKRFLDVAPLRFERRDLMDALRREAFRVDPNWATKVLNHP
jgi:hypothetical protein